MSYRPTFHLNHRDAPDDAAVRRAQEWARANREQPFDPDPLQQPRRRSFLHGFAAEVVKLQQQLRRGGGRRESL